MRRREAMVQVSASGVSSSVSVSEAAAVSSASLRSILATTLLLLLLLLLGRDDGASCSDDDGLGASGEGARLVRRRGESGAG
jgi:hypothetical protein